MVNILARAFFALGDTRTPMKISVFCLLLNLALALALVWHFKQGGLGIANTLTSLVNVTLLAHALRRKLKTLDMAALRRPVWLLVGLSLLSRCPGVCGLASVGAMARPREPGLENRGGVCASGHCRRRLLAGGVALSDPGGERDDGFRAGQIQEIGPRLRRVDVSNHELVDSSRGGDGPVAVIKFAEYPGYRNGAEIPAVPSFAPVIAHDETFILRHGDFRKIGRRMVLSNKDSIFRVVVVFREDLAGYSSHGARANGFERKLCAIHIDPAIFDCHRVTGNGDDAFNPKFTAIFWIGKQNQVAALRVSDPIGIFYRDDAVPRRNGWIHGCARDAERLNELVADI